MTATPVIPPEDPVVAEMKSVPGLAEPPKTTRARRIVARTTPETLKDALGGLRALGFRHLSAISGVDLGGNFEVVYHLSGPRGVVVSLHAPVPKTAPKIPTVTPLFPVAGLYERECHDLLGIEFEGLADSRRLLLYEGWPEGQYPLRKDWKPPTSGGEKHA